ncbi:hypothetical protein SK128_020296 [Halocaridina rubra]|uniref:Uncharacterized protein n=1 Tax=Halocaridina rubra TaxID=373956 RepID=A0AAN8XIQ0_HALRR
MALTTLDTHLSTQTLGRTAHTMAHTQISVTHPSAGTDTRIHGLIPEHTIMMNSLQNHTIETNHGQIQEQTTTMTMDTNLLKHVKIVTLVHVNAQSLLAHFEIIMLTKDYNIDILCGSFCIQIDSDEVNSADKGGTLNVMLYRNMCYKLLWKRMIHRVMVKLPLSVDNDEKPVVSTRELATWKPVVDHD